MFFFQQNFGLQNRVDYVDLLYIHQPVGDWLAGYRQLEKAYRAGKAKAIGISNFEGKYLVELEQKWEVVPQFIQVEAHPYFTQKELRKILDKYGIKIMAWYPLGHGDKALINEPVFTKLGEKYGKSSAQIILRWHTQMSNSLNLSIGSRLMRDKGGFRIIFEIN